MVTSARERKHHLDSFTPLTESLVNDGSFCSRVRLYPGFVDLKEADRVLEQLCQDIPWKQRTGIREGKSSLTWQCIPPALSF